MCIDMSFMWFYIISSWFCSLVAGTLMTASVCTQEADNHALNHVSTRLCDTYTGCAVTFALHQGGLFVCHVFIVAEGQEACGAPSPLQLKPVSCPGELGPGLQDSWGRPDSSARLVWSKVCCFAARCLDRICSLPATLHPQALLLIRITCHVSYITWSSWCQLSATEMW